LLNAMFHALNLLTEKKWVDELRSHEECGHNESNGDETIGV